MNPYYLSFALLALGLVFITLEVFFPSLGLLGTLAAVSMIGGGVVAYQGPGSLFMVYLMVSFVMVPAILLLALKIFPKTPIGKHFTLEGPSFNRKEGQATEEGIDTLLGRTGVTLTSLHPSGIAIIDDRRVDVVSRGEMIEKEAAIKVVKVEGNRIVVERS
ncbi:MAG: NfeD family protein [Planctomycetota bacterium]